MGEQKGVNDMSEEMLAQNTENESTTSQDLETQQEVDTGTETDTAPQGSENTEETTTPGIENGGDAETQAETTPFLEIQYNHEKRELSKKEATTLAQKGIYYEKSFDILERVATLKGVTVDELLGNIEKAEDEAYKESLIEQFGEDEDTINSMMELYEIKKQQKLDNAKQKREQEILNAEQSLNTRLANEFLEMKTDFPELTDFASLPAAVKKAANDGMSLSHAYLLYMHKENKKIADAKENSKQSAEKSAGSMTGEKEEENSAISALLSGLKE
jgi:hypothetical protein